MWNGIDEEEDIEEEAASFLYEVLGRYLWMKIPVLAERLSKAPPKVRRYMKQHYHKDKFEEFLCEYKDLFYIENGRVAQYNESFDVGHDEAVQYFEEILEDYLEPVDIKRFSGHIGQAPLAAKDFINRFYPGVEVKQFLLSNTDTFLVYKNNTVWLVESDCVRYFKKVITDFGGGEYYLNFRGHIGQAEPHLIKYVNETYPDEDFLVFLDAHDDVFDIDEELQVFLQQE